MISLKPYKKRCVLSALCAIALILPVAYAQQLARPRNVDGYNTGDDLLDVQLLWKDNSTGEIAFSIERNRQGAGWVESGRVAANYTAYRDTSMAIGIYQYRIRAVGAQGCSDYSDTVQVDVSGIPWLEMTAPSAGACFKPGAQIYVRWESNQVSAVQVSYSLNDGLTWESALTTEAIHRGSGEWGNFAWTVPSTTTTGFFIKVNEYGAEELFSESGPMTISSEPCDLEAARPRMRNIPPGASSNAGCGEYSARILSLRGQRLFLQQGYSSGTFRVRLPQQNGVYIIDSRFGRQAVSQKIIHSKQGSNRNARGRYVF